MTDTSNRVGTPDPSATEVNHELDRLTDELVEAHSPRFDHPTVQRHVRETYAELEAGATIRTHLIALTSHAVREKLAKLLD
ncbi:hypothetical protein EV193_102415 [Herbihabitans rhizosphaerae]|uniref:Protein-tyrosine-phosphatase-like N-terminal domain-containing protein n=1 Tax=Herbihabitans rhizosphaerae TaxID=1872711 RepID=A0A4Q7L2J4_9PSEU|nr:hypothetical protein [Herbihabitans rhizosphaerae]RZS43435.1 hypothetical protein EV193_102415 [Herbihabitans rhizosphaerae]